MAEPTSQARIFNRNRSLSSSKNCRQRLEQHPSICKICGAPAIYSNFGVISCSSCKMFFKRNAELGLNRFKCDFNYQCEVNIITRRICAACRLAKCFASGMEANLIRCSRSGRTPSKKCATRNSAESAANALSVQETNVLSKLTRCYDEQNELTLVNRFLSQQHSLPVKLRFKSRPVSEIVSSLISNSRLLIENNENFASLCRHDRSLLLRCQIKYVAVMKFIFISQQTDLLEHIPICRTMNSFLRTISTATNKCSMSLFDFDITFLQLILTIVCFTTFDYTTDENMSRRHLINGDKIVQIQNMYVELAWRYLLSKYKYDESDAQRTFLFTVD